LESRILVYSPQNSVRKWSKSSKEGFLNWTKPTFFHFSPQTFNDISGLIPAIHPEDDKRSVCARGRLIETLVMGNIFHFSPPQAL